MTAANQASVSRPFVAKTSRIPFSVIAILVVAIEALVLIYGVTGQITLRLAWTTHLATVAMLAGLFWMFRREPLGWRYFQLAALTAVCGVFGAATYLPTEWVRRSSTRPARGAGLRFAPTEGIETVDPVSELCDALRDNRINIDTPSAPVSLVEMVRSGSQDEQFAALRTIAFNFDNRFSPALQSALSSTDAAVRVMAATVLAKLKKSFTDRITQAELKLASAPAESAPLLDLIEALIEYSESGLLPDDASQTCRSKAEKLFTHDVPVNPEHEKRMRRVRHLPGGPPVAAQ